ncbi:MAG TPA: hypothetical protein VL976_13255 [Xanthobacteraceae bacterium]|nr:hypothetical protein [Xanthobacteraceae bacterium]
MLLEATNVSKAFGSFLAVSGADLSVAEHEIIGLIGPNGAGKPGWASTNQVIARLNTSAAQYGGRMRQARRCAYAPIDLNRHPERAGPRPSEKPDSTMNIATAHRP